MNWNQMKDMGRSVFASANMKVAGVTAMVTIALCLVAKHELGECKIADQQGMIGTIVAVPRLHICLFITSLRDQDAQAQENDERLYTGISSGIVGGYTSIKEDADTNLGKSWPCVQQYMNQRSSSSRPFAPQHGLDS